jgi:hypothetical protein
MGISVALMAITKNAGLEWGSWMVSHGRERISETAAAVAGGSYGRRRRRRRERERGEGRGKTVASHVVVDRR